MTVRPYRLGPLLLVVVAAGLVWVGLPASAASEGQLSWPPPALTDPTVVEVSPGATVVELDPGRDYQVILPGQPLQSGLVVVGGRNVVIIGGEIRIPWQGDAPSIIDRRGLLLSGQTGTAHVEGLLITGEDLSEGIQIAAPQATVQLQNIRVEDVHARDQSGFSDNHPDVVQAWGGVAELRVDRLSGSTDYQGLYLSPSSGAVGRIDLRRVNIVGRPTSRFLLWADPGLAKSLTEVFVQPAPERGASQALWPDPGAWPGVGIGAPPGGDFVKPGAVGLGYASPGYVGGAPPEPAPGSGGEPEEAQEPEEPPAPAEAEPTQTAPPAPEEPEEPPVPDEPASFTFCEEGSLGWSRGELVHRVQGEMPASMQRFGEESTIEGWAVLSVFELTLRRVCQAGSGQSTWQTLGWQTF